MEEEKDLSVDTESTDMSSDATEQAVETTEKTYTQAELDDIMAKQHSEWEGGFQKKLDKAIARKMREYDDEEFKKDQLIQTLKEQTMQDTLDGLLDMSEKQYGVTIQRTRTNKNDEKVLGKNDAKEILDMQDDEFAEKELNRLANLKRTDREEETYSELKSSLDAKKYEAQRKKEIEQNGLDEGIVNSDDFKAFEEKFSKSTSISDIYEMYSKVHDIKEDKPFSAGSLKDTKSKQTDEFYTIDEYNALTDKDLDDPKVYEKAMKSMYHFYNS